MIANQVALSQFLTLNNTQFIIPIYQRNYDWTISECRQLLDDILNVGKSKTIKSHFVGSIVFVGDGHYGATNLNELVVIDGQQRLTTFTLIYIVLRNFAKQIKNEQLERQINTQYLINEFANSDKIKLKATDINRQILTQLIEQPQNNDIQDSNLTTNYNYITRSINETNYEYVLAGLNKIEFVRVSLDRNYDDAQRIFESLNSTGKQLEQGDLIRNFLLMNLNDKHMKEIHKKYWVPIEDNTKKNVSDFIRDYLTLELKRITNKNKVYVEFKTAYGPLNEEQKTEQLDKIKLLSIYWGKLKNPNLETNSEKIKSELENICKLEVNVTYPFLMQVYCDYECDRIKESEFVDILKFIQSFVVRRAVTGLPTNSLNKIFMGLYSKVDDNDYVDSIYRYILKGKGSHAFPTNQMVIEYLKIRDVYSLKSIKTILTQLEYHNNKERVIFDDKITIEHIFPQNPHSQWRKDLSEQDYNTLKEKVNTIGNLTCSGNNGFLSNRAFIEKRDMNNDGGKQGYRFSSLRLNEDLKNLEQWNVENYLTRHNNMTDSFLEVWQYPKIEILSNGENEFISIKDLSDTTGTQILAYNLDGDENKCSTWRKLYTDILEKIMSDNIRLIDDTDFLTKYKIQSIPIATNSSSYTLSNGLYLFTNYASSKIVDNLKEICEEYELELSVLYQENIIEN